ncbi:probable methyltransferase PMT2 [Tanacetum coccineum]
MFHHLWLESTHRHIDFSLTSPFGGGRLGRVKRKNQKAVAKKEAGGDADEDNDCIRHRCESFSTYPRMYDLIHANSLFSLYSDRCNFEDILLEMDRILWPEGVVILRDDVDVLRNLGRASGCHCSNVGQPWCTSCFTATVTHFTPLSLSLNLVLIQIGLVMDELLRMLLILEENDPRRIFEGEFLRGE